MINKIFKIKLYINEIKINGNCNNYRIKEKNQNHLKAMK
jgi:hypothetical protein